MAELKALPFKDIVHMGKLSKEEIMRRTKEYQKNNLNECMKRVMMGYDLMCNAGAPHVPSYEVYGIADDEVMKFCDKVASNV